MQEWIMLKVRQQYTSNELKISKTRDTEVCLRRDLIMEITRHPDTEEECFVVVAGRLIHTLEPFESVKQKVLQ